MWERALPAKGRQSRPAGSQSLFVLLVVTFVA